MFDPPYAGGARHAVDENSSGERRLNGRRAQWAGEGGMTMSWMIWPENQALSAIALTGIALPLLYAARAPVHALIMSCTTAVAAALRVTARTLLSTDRK